MQGTYSQKSCKLPDLGREVDPPKQDPNYFYIKLRLSSKGNKSKVNGRCRIPTTSKVRLLVSNF